MENRPVPQLLVAVNGRRSSIDELTRAIAATSSSSNSGYFTVAEVDYHDRLKHPHLERKAGISDTLTTIARPRRGRAAWRGRFMIK